MISMTQGSQLSEKGLATQNPNNNSQKAILFQCIDNCAISEATLALASLGQLRCVTISYRHCWTL